MKSLSIAAASAVSGVRNLKYENPIVTKELRTRMRGGKAHWLMLGYVLLLSIVLFFGYYGMWTSSGGHTDPATWMQMRVGFNLFWYLTITQTIMIALIAPSLSASALTMEHEQQTLEMLSMTTLTPRNIIAGKMSSPMLFILMLLGISVPLAGVCLTFGSISPLEMFVTYLMLIGWAFLLCSVGVFFSSCFKRTVWASLVSFGMVVAGTLFMWIYPYVPRGLFYGGSGPWQMIHSAIVPAVGLECALDSGPVFGFKLPFALVAIATNVGLGLLLLSISLTHLRFHRVNRTLLVRLLTLLLVWAELFLYFGNSIAGRSRSTSDIWPMLVVLGVLMSICIPIFATGTLMRNRGLARDFLGGLVYKKLADGRPTGGLWFLAIMFTGGFLIILLSLLFDSTGSLLVTGNLVDLLGAGGALLAWVLATGALAMLFSSVSRTRAAAITFTFAFIVLSWIVLPSMASWHLHAGDFTGWRGDFGFTAHWNIAYLWPGVSISRVAGNWIQGSNAPELLLPGDRVWLGAIVSWLVIGLAAAWFAQRRMKKPGGIPLED